MYRITNLLLLLMMTLLFVLPASAIMHASGSPQNSDDGGGGSSSDDGGGGSSSDDGGGGSSSDNSDESDTMSMDNNDAMGSGSMDNNDDKSDAWSMDKSNNALDTMSMDNNDAMGSGSMDNNDAMGSGSMDNSNNALNPQSTGQSTVTNNALNPQSTGQSTVTTSPLSPPSTGGPAVTNNALRVESNSTNSTTIAYCDSCNNDIYNSGGDLASMVLAVHNRERALVGVPPLVWNDTLAIGAKTWAEHLATTGEFSHSSGYLPGYEYGESIAGSGHNPTVPIAQNMQGWIAEKNNYHGGPITETNAGSISHYTMMVWRTTTSVGCGIASGGPNDYSGRDILVCRYSPGPTHGGGNVFGENPY